MSDNPIGSIPFDTRCLNAFFAGKAARKNQIAAICRDAGATDEFMLRLIELVELGFAVECMPQLHYFEVAMVCHAEGAMWNVFRGEDDDMEEMGCGDTPLEALQNAFAYHDKEKDPI